MPIYEYLCLDCNHLFEELRPMRQADSPIACHCCKGTNSSRKISLFSAHSDGKVIAGSDQGCTTCASHNCASCNSLN